MRQVSVEVTNQCVNNCIHCSSESVREYPLEYIYKHSLYLQNCGKVLYMADKLKDDSGYCPMQKIFKRRCLNR